MYKNTGSIYFLGIKKLNSIGCVMVCDEINNLMFFKKLN